MNDTPMFLSAEEVRELTGARKRDLQAEWLKEHGYKFDINRQGFMVVLRAHVEQKLGIQTTSKRKKPDFSWMEKDNG